MTETLRTIKPIEGKIKREEDMETLQTMTEDHPQWEEFLDHLCGPEGCNFHEGSDGRLMWTCGGGGIAQHKPIAASRILAKYFPDVDLQSTITYFEENGGFCDCEILFNAHKAWN